MQTTLSIVRDTEGFGDHDHRGYIPSSVITAELRGTDVVLRISRERVEGIYPREAEDATTYLDPDERRTLAAWLASLPESSD